MALFFDARWFDERLAASGLDRAGVSAALGMPHDELVLIIKDQRELAPREVMQLAALLGVSTAEMARRAGIGTPDVAPAVTTPIASPDRALLEAALERIGVLEARVASLEAQVSGKNYQLINFANERLDESRVK